MSAGFAFKKARFSGPVLSRQESERQGSAVRSATAALQHKDSVRAFLNTWHDGLNGRPLDVAVASDAGLEAVEAALVVAASARFATPSGAGA